MTARELVWAILLNVELDDKVIIEYENKSRDGDLPRYETVEPRRVMRINTEKNALIECYDE